MLLSAKNRFLYIYVLVIFFVNKNIVIVTSISFIYNAFYLKLVVCQLKNVKAFLKLNI